MDSAAQGRQGGAGSPAGRRRGPGGDPSPGKKPRTSRAGKGKKKGARPTEGAKASRAAAALRRSGEARRGVAYVPQYEPRERPRAAGPPAAVSVRQQPDGVLLVSWSIPCEILEAAGDALGSECRFVLRLVPVDGAAPVRDIEAEGDAGEMAVTPPDGFGALRVMVGYLGPFRSFYPAARSAPVAARS